MHLLKPKLGSKKGWLRHPFPKEPRGQAVRDGLFPLTVYYTSEEDVLVAMQDDFSQKLDTLVKVGTNLSTHVAEFEDRQRQGQLLLLLVLPPLSTGRGQGTKVHPPPLTDVSEEVVGGWLEE